ncbi:ABC-2 type transport system ATP-binding protein [Pseudonocardia sediminis]|uniref:ABC-2 type transport system ATP-binding protein n=1 Tax=Pseudonocardia sediminis TaxID=1397368 RepID=A0A4Q7UZM5_PSEST|nr:ABC transporter ATP-binding protein [Pseudonocardia sediminis]RZT87617.1 ABC-2 type transport system ATP-binding protein [Pseudonocardia sediminis]
MNAPRDAGDGGPVIHTEALTKRFGRITAVDRVDLDVPAGSRFGLLGPNGSGKTTMVRMLLGLVHATSGTAHVLGEPMPRAAASVLPRVGALVENPAAWPALSGRSNLRMLDAAGSRGGLVVRPGARRRRVEEALEQVGLAGVDRRPVKAYSLGMRQRLGIAAALLRRPPLLILDEPTNGLDPRGIGEIRSLMVALNDGGTTVVLSSHLLSEVEALCTRIGLMDAGRLVLTEDMDVLRAPTGRITVRTPDADGAARLLGRAVEERPGATTLQVRADDPADLNAHLVAHGVAVTGLEVERRTLEQVVLQRSGSGADRFDPRRNGLPGPRRSDDGDLAGPATERIVR